MINNLEIKNFRSISFLNLSNLADVNLLVGKNNTGKSTILECVYIIQSIIENIDVKPVINKIISIRDTEKLSLRKTNSKQYYKEKTSLLFYNLDTATDIQFTFSVNSLESQITICGDIDEIAKRSFALERKMQDNYEVKSKIYKVREKINKKTILLLFEYKFNDNISYIFYDIEGPSIIFEMSNDSISSITPKQTKSKVNFHHHSQLKSNLVSNLHYVFQKKKEQELFSQLRKIEPQLISLSLGKNNQILCDIGLEERVLLDAMGEGFKRVLGITTTLYLTKNSIFLIDEFENGLHYSSQNVLWKAIADTAKRFNVQVFVSTHSYEVAKQLFALNEKNNKIQSKLFRVEKVDKKIDVVEYDHESIEAAFTLGWEVR